jgi:CHAT domain-containing protein/tetratricopeptide (TPR) repeat protein
MNTFKTILLILVLASPLNVWAVENDAMGHPITSQTTELSIPFAEMDDAALIQYALQLREANPKLFRGAQGVLVLEVSDLQVQKTELQRGDIVVVYEGQQVKSVEQLISMEQVDIAKSQVELQFIRAETVQTIVLQKRQVGIQLADIDSKVKIDIRGFFNAVVEMIYFGKKDELRTYLQTVQRKNSITFIDVFIDKLFEEMQPGDENNDVRYLIYRSFKEAYPEAHFETLLNHSKIGLVKNPKADKSILKKYILSADEASIEELEEFAESALKENNYDQAYQTYVAIINKKPTYGMAYRGIVLVYKNALNNVDEAIELFKQMLTQYPDNAAIYYGLGYAYYTKNDYELAIEHFKLSIQHDLQFALSWNSVAAIYCSQNKIELAILHVKEALLIDPNLEFALNNFALCSKKAGQFEEFITFTNFIKHYLGQTQKSIEIVHRLIADEKYERAIEHINKSQYEKAIELLHESLILAKKIEDKKLIGTYLSVLGGVYSAIGKEKEAHEYLTQALAYAHQLEDNRLEMGILMNLGLHTERQKQFEKTHAHYQNAFLIAKALEDEQGKKTALKAIEKLTETIVFNFSENPADSALLRKVIKEHPTTVKIFIYKNVRLLYADQYLGVKLNYDLKGVIALYNDANPEDNVQVHNLYDTNSGHIVDKTFFLHVAVFLGSNEKALTKLISLNKSFTEEVLHTEVNPETFYSFPKNSEIHEPKSMAAAATFKKPTLKMVNTVQSLAKVYHKIFGGDYFVSNLNRNLTLTEDEVRRIYYAYLIKYLADMQLSGFRDEFTLENYKKAQDIYTQYGLVKNILDIQLQLVKFYLSRGEFDEAALIISAYQQQAEQIDCSTCILSIFETNVTFYSDLFEYDFALFNAQKALDFLKDIPHRKPTQGIFLLEIGRLKNKLNHRDAIKYLERASKTVQNSSLYEKSYHEAAILSEMAIYYEAQGNILEAQLYDEKALYIVEQELKKYPGGKATIMGKDSISIFGEFKGTRFISLKKRIANHLGGLFLKMNQYDKGWELLKLASYSDRLCRTQIDYDHSEEDILFTCNFLLLRSAKGVNDYKGMIVGYALLGDYYKKQKQYLTAVDYYKNGINTAENIRTYIAQKELKSSFMAGNIRIYDNLIFVFQQLHRMEPNKGYDQKSFEIFERKQGRVFLEEMGESGARRFAGIPKKVVQQETKLTYKIEATRKNLADARVKGKEAQQIRQLEKQFAKLKAEHEDFEKTLQTDYPAYYALKYPKPVALEKLQKDVLNSDEFTLIYNVMEESTILWVIGKQQFQMLTLDISEEELQAKVEAFRQSPNTLIKAIKEIPADEIGDFAIDNLPQLRQAGYELYQSLIPAKIKTSIKDAHTLYIVPTGPLYSLPFGALDTHNPTQHDTPHYLIQNYSIVYLSSASLLKTIRDTERDEKSDRYPFLAFADPEYPKKCPLKPDNVTEVIQTARTEAYLKLAGSGENGCFIKEDELKDTKKQAEAIAKLFNAPQDSDPLQLREKASRSNVFKFNYQKRLDDYRYLLFAAHAILPEETSNVTQPAIVLSHPELEGYLTMADVFGLKMNADFVMLSACNTGRGEKIKGEGVRGLTRAFMYAGTPAVSVSLWYVESISAKNLSVGLFEHLQQGKSLAQALRQSKLDLIMADEEMDMYQHPYFWAPFVVFGDGS